MSVNSKMQAIADAVRAKTGVGGKLTLDGMASAINGLSMGAGIKRKNGSFTIDSACKATVSCGFQPDLVVIYTAPVHFDSSDTRETNLKFVFAERKTTNREMSDCEQTSGIYTGIAAPSATGFSVEMKGYSFSWEASNSLVINKTFDYVAVKYTV